MTDKAGSFIGWLLKALLAIAMWVLLELIAGYIHVKMMKKAGVCPYMRERSER